MNDNIFDLYVDYLLSSFGSVTATGLSGVVDGLISHDKITRLLSRKPETSADLWSVVKPLIRQIGSPDGVLIIDDSISEKPYTDENDIICWHYDHCKGVSVRGINFMTALYYIRDVALPVSFQIIAKTEYYINPKDSKEKRRCPVPKNQYCREMIKQAVINQIQFGKNEFLRNYVVTDVWFASAENMMFIKHEINKEFVMPVKTNRNIAISYDDKGRGKYVRADMSDLRTDIPKEIFLEDVDFPMLLVKQVFANKDGSTGILYPVSSDTGMTYEQITATYRKRWNVECYHKSLKQNVALEKSPAKVVNTQKNHFFASLCGYVKLEMLRFSGKFNHFALRAKIYISALRVAFSELQKITAFENYCVR
jgi:hypothetical protein